MPTAFPQWCQRKQAFGERRHQEAEPTEETFIPVVILWKEVVKARFFWKCMPRSVEETALHVHSLMWTQSKLHYTS